MDTAAPWGRCIICGRRILSSFYQLHGGGYTVRVHDRCYRTEHSGLVGDALTERRAVQAAKLDGIEARFGGQGV